MTGRAVWTVALTVAVVASAPIARADTGTVPTYVRTIGGPGHAEIYPSGVEIDPSDGSVIVADTGNDRVKKYDARGNLAWDVGGFGTTAGKFSDPRDVGVDAATGDVYVADTSNVRIVELNGDTGAYIASWKGDPLDKIGTPIGVTVTDGKVYVADASKRKVRVFDTSGAPLVAFGQSGGCMFSAIRDVDADSAGNIYIANYLFNNILKLAPDGTCVTQWGKKGTADGWFKNPYGVRVAYDPALSAEAVFVADSNNERVQEFTTSGDFVAKLGTKGPAANQFGGLRRVAVSAPYDCPPNPVQCIDVAGADLWGWKIGVWHSDGTGGYAFDTQIPDPPIPPPGEGGTSLTSPLASVFNQVRGIGFDSNGDLRMMDAVNQRVVWSDRFGNLPSGPGTWATCGKRGWTAGAFNWPRGVAVDQATDQVWVADTKQSRLQVIQPDCSSAVFIGSQGSTLGKFNWPYSIAIRQSDRIAFVADTKNNRVVAYDVATRTPEAAFGTLGSGANQFSQPGGIAVVPGSGPDAGHVLVADTKNNRVVELAFDGGASTFSWIGTFTTSSPALKQPQGVAADSGGRIFIADSGRARLVVLNANGTVRATITTPPTGQPAFSNPQNVAVDANDCVYFADTYNDRIHVYEYSTGACS